VMATMISGAVRCTSSRLSTSTAASPVHKEIWSALAVPASRPTAWQTTNATASASVSRTRFVVPARRSVRLRRSWAISCTSVATASAGGRPGSSSTLPPSQTPFADAISAEYSSAMACSRTNWSSRSRCAPGSPLMLPIWVSKRLDLSESGDGNRTPFGLCPRSVQTEITESAPCSLRVGRTVISTS
jgi:hypothetical protein